MYLAKHIVNGKPRFYIRESYFDGACFRSRTLFDLDSNPEKYIIYPGGNGYYIDEVVCDEIRKYGVKNITDKLDDVFWPFLDPRIKRVLEGFSRKRTSGRGRLDCDSSKHTDDFHIFDKRRVHFMRFGRMDQGNIGAVSPKLMRRLQNRSRDEIEQYFMRSEAILRPHEIKNYVFVIFNLQRHFQRLNVKTMPQILDPDELDAFFLEDICRLNGDEAFWYGSEKNESLNDYLVRYLIMYFDYEFGQSTFLNDYIRRFMDDRRRFRFPAPQTTVGLDEASDRFRVEKSVLKKMTRRELTSRYRKLALKLHPDQGGDHERFIKLTEAYKAMIRKKT
ncbi:MAG: J domain-containing protein [Desulfobacterales bacterium]